LGASLTILFYPLHKKYLAWTHGREKTAAILSVVSVIILLVIPCIIVIMLVTSQLTFLLDVPLEVNQPASVSQMFNLLKNKLVDLSAQFDFLAGFRVNLVPFVRERMKELGGIIAHYTPMLVTQTLDLALHIFIMIIVSFYLFKDGPAFLKFAIRLSPVKDRYERSLALGIQTTIQGVFYGSFLTALAQAVLATLSFYIAGLDAFLVWGLLTFFMAFLPMLGTGVVMVPLVLSLFLGGQINQGIFLLIYGAVVVGSIDNLLRPLLTRSNMHPLILFLSVFGGLAIFGPLGLFLGPILMATLTATLKIYSEEFA
ncbi:MAG: AI-2E family transporter, partial [bacterium]|nr:AI-2E family transporter [bacterium]